jgi:uncharacterized zinc-type alcohol dehydrogenase-like protein
MPSTQAFAAQTAKAALAQATIPRREPGPRDVQIDIQFCGVCHSDLHTARGEWTWAMFPCVPGHEIVGTVTRVGGDVQRFKAGDRAAVGCMVDSCRTCANCKNDLEQYCDTGTVWTYSSPDARLPGQPTFGGYSQSIVVDEAFVLNLPASLDPAAAAPLLCAGITTYSPLRHWGAAKGKKVGIVGLGGLGHMGVKFAHAFGCHTVLFTTSPGKTEDARRLGADEIVISKDDAQMAKHANSFDFILNTVAASHNLDAYTTLLRTDGTLCLVGAPEHPHPSPSIWPLLMKRRSIAGSAIGGIAETQEMLDFCAQHNVVSDVEVIPIQKINEAYERMLKSDVKYRFVIDLASLRA